MNDCRHARSKQGIQNKRYQWSLRLWESGGFSYKEPNQNQNAQGVGVYSKESHIQDPMRKSKTIAMIHHLRITFTAYYCCANRESNPGQMLGRHLCYHYTIGALAELHMDIAYYKLHYDYTITQCSSFHIIFDLYILLLILTYQNTVSLNKIYDISYFVLSPFTMCHWLSKYTSFWYPTLKTDKL